MREGEVNVSYLENKAKDMCCALSVVLFPEPLQAEM